MVSGCGQVADLRPAAMPASRAVSAAPLIRLPPMRKMSRGPDRSRYTQTRSHDGRGENARPPGEGCGDRPCAKLSSRLITSFQPAGQPDSMPAGVVQFVVSAVVGGGTRALPGQVYLNLASLTARPRKATQDCGRCLRREPRCS